MLKSLQLPQWPFCNRNNSPAKCPPPYLLEHLGVSFTDTAFRKKIKFFSLTWSKSCCFCLSAHLLLYRPAPLLWLPFVPSPSQSVSCFRWTQHMLPGSICQAFCTLLPFSALTISEGPWNNHYISALVTSRTHTYKAVDVRHYLENFYSCREGEWTIQIKGLLYSHIRRTSCLVDFNHAG